MIFTCSSTAVQIDMVSMICHCIGNTEDNIRGRQMPVHYSWKEGNLVSISSPVGTQFPQAVGCAMASAYKGEDNVSISWLGDGTAAEGDFHYALNFASIFKKCPRQIHHYQIKNFAFWEKTDAATAK